MSDLLRRKRLWSYFSRARWLRWLLCTILALCLVHWSGRSATRNIQEDEPNYVRQDYNAQVARGDNLAERLFPKAFGAYRHDTQVRPFYGSAFRGHDALSQHVDADSLTLTTWITIDRLHRLKAIARAFPGPISAVVHITSGDPSAASQFRALDRFLSDIAVKLPNLDIHLVTSNYAVQHNAWRNLARFLARTDWIMMVDADFDLCTDVAKGLRDFRMSGDEERRQRMQEGHIALVIPAFEWVPEVAEKMDGCPANKEELASLYSSLQIDAFEAGSRPLHWSTDYPRMFNTSEAYRVTEPEWMYEPYVIFRKDVKIVCDERFLGYGYDRAACISEMYLRNMDFYVLPEAFMIHADHPRRPLDTEMEFENAVQWNTYRNDICSRVAQDLAHKHTLHTAHGDRVRLLCSNIDRFGVDRYLPFLEELSSTKA